MPNKKNKQVKIYLAGRIPIGNEPGVDPFWRKKYIHRLKSIIPNVIFLDPTYRDIDETDSRAVFGHDLFLIKQADLILVNAEIKLGLGTAQEMIIAKYFQKPIVTISPRGSYYSPITTSINGKEVNKWRHPFLATISDWIVQDFEDLKPIMVSKLKGKKIPPWKAFVKETIRYYLEQYFPRDKKTQKLFKV